METGPDPYPTYDRTVENLDFKINFLELPIYKWNLMR